MSKRGIFMAFAAGLSVGAAAFAAAQKSGKIDALKAKLVDLGNMADDLAEDLKDYADENNIDIGKYFHVTVKNTEGADHIEVGEVPVGKNGAVTKEMDELIRVFTGIVKEKEAANKTDEAVEEPEASEASEASEGEEPGTEAPEVEEPEGEEPGTEAPEGEEPKASEASEGNEHKDQE